jgi:hypothetical protein
MGTSFLGLGENDIRFIITALIFGAVGGLLHAGTTEAPTVEGSPDPSSKGKAVAVGIVAAIGALWLTPPATTLICVAQSLLIGFFGQALLATFQARVTAGIATERLRQVESEARAGISQVRMLQLRAPDAEASLVEPSQENALVRLNKIAEIAGRPIGAR